MLAVIELLAKVIKVLRVKDKLVTMMKMINKSRDRRYITAYYVFACS